MHADIENAQDEIRSLGDRIDDLKHEKNQNEKDAEDIQRRLIRDGDKMTVEELNVFKLEQVKLEEKKNEIQEQLKDYFDLIPFALAGETVTNISEQLTNERNMSDLKFKQDDVNEKIIQIRQDIESEKNKTNTVFHVPTADFYDEQIKRLVRKYFYSVDVEIPTNSTTLHDFSNAEVNEFNQLVSTLKHSFKESFSRLNTEYSYLKNQLDSIYRKIRDAEKSAEDEYISNLREKKEGYDKRIISIESEISNLNQKIGELQNHPLPDHQNIRGKEAYQ